MRGTTSFTEIVKSQGKKPSSELISYKRVHPNEFEIKNLGVLPQSYVIRMERVRFADDLPVAYEIASIPEKIIRGFKESEITEHFFKTLTDNGYEIGKSQQTISASLANSSLAKHLKVKTGDALLSLTQISFLQDGQALNMFEVTMLVTVLNFIWRTIRSHYFFLHKNRANTMILW